VSLQARHVLARQTNWSIRSGYCASGRVAVSVLWGEDQLCCVAELSRTRSRRLRCAPPLARRRAELSLGRPARRAPGHTSADTQIKLAHTTRKPVQDAAVFLAPIVSLAATASRAALRAPR